MDHDTDTASMWSTTLTGTVLAGRDAPEVWERIRKLLKLDSPAFGERVLTRMPLTFKAVDQERARRQCEAMRMRGADAVLRAEDDTPRLWLRIDASTRGPVSMAYARSAVQAGRLSDATRVCISGTRSWQPLANLIEVPAEVPAAMPVSAPEPTPEPAPEPTTTAAPTASTAPASADPPTSETASPQHALLPTHLQARGMHAGFWLRALAFVLDFLILLLPLFFVGFMTGLLLAVARSGEAAENAGSMLGLVFGWLYFALFEASSFQATPGKLALGLRVTDVMGRRIGFGRATGRYFGKILSALILLIGYMLAGWTQRKQALHDLMTGCCVVQKPALDTFRKDGPDAAAQTRGGMPGWAAALIVIGVCVVPCSIMAAIAIPAYQQHVLRNQVTEGIKLSRHARAAVADYLNRHQSLPGDNRSLGLASASRIHGRYVSSVRVDNGAVTIGYARSSSPYLHDGHLVFTPNLSHGVVVWHCASRDLPSKYLPARCR